MPRYNEHQERRRAPRRSSSPRSDSLGAREIRRRLTWLTDVAVYWNGTADTPGATEHPRSLRRRLREALASKSPGLYAVDVLHPLSQQPIGRIKRISAKDLAAATNYLKKLKTGHGDQDKTTHSPETSLSHLSTRHDIFATAFHSLSTPSMGLALEANALWYGSESDRPSTQLSNGQLQDHLGMDTPAAVRRAAAFCLGQRRKNSVPKELKAWQALGQKLPEWELLAISGLTGKEAGLLSRSIRSSALGHRVWGDAVAEYMMWSRNHQPKLPEFIRGLQACIASLQELKHHTDDRGSKLVWCIGEAMQECDAFTEISGNQGYAWNHEFMSVCRSKLQSSLSNRLPFMAHAAGLDGGLKGVFRWFLDIELRDIDLMKLKKIQPGTHDPNYQFIQRLDEIIKKRLIPDDDSQSGLLAATAARLGATTHPEDRLKQLAAWLRHCSSVCLPGTAGDGAVRLAVDSILNSFRQVDNDQERNHIVAIAAEHGGGILSLLEHRLGLVLRPPSYDHLIRPLTQTRENYENVLFLLASLPEEYNEHIPWLLAEKRVTWLNHIVSQKPERLALAMDFLTQVDKPWLELPPTEAFTWVYAATLEHQPAADMVMAWTISLHNDAMLDWSTIELATGDLLRFLCSGDNCQRQEFLVEHPKLLPQLVTSALTAIDQGADDEFDIIFSERLQCLELTYYWELNCGSGERFMHRLLTRLERLEKRGDTLASTAGRSRGENEMAVLLSAGRFGRLLTILKTPNVSAENVHSDPLVAWNWLGRFPEVQTFLSESTGNPDLLPAIVRFLQQTDLALRLQNRKGLTRAFKAWVRTEPGHPVPTLPSGIPEPFRESIATLMIHRQQAGAQAELPKSLAKILNHIDSLKSELAALEQKAGTEKLSSTISVRMQKIQAYLDDPEALNTWVHNELSKELSKQLQMARLNHLIAISESTISDYWSQLCGSARVDTEAPEWVNALLIYLSTTHNKRLLKDLIRQLAKGQETCKTTHPVNHTFLDDIAKVGLSPDKWTAPLTATIQSGTQSYRIAVESNPLNVLQMGSVFGTCLRPGGDHSYAAVANAVEVNKAVITIVNKQGIMIARKLVALSRNGVLFGFRSYGKGPMCKAMMDGLARTLADRCGARLAGDDDNSDLDVNSLTLFAKWYNDGPEVYDPWLLEPDPKAFAVQLLQSRLEDLLYENRLMAARACIYLGRETENILAEAPCEIPDAFYTLISDC